MPKQRSDKYSEIPEVSHRQLEELVAPHVDSFNFFLEEGLRLLVNDLDKQEILIGPEGNKKAYLYWIEEVRIGKPIVQDEGRKSKSSSKRTALLDTPLYPMEVII